MKYLADFQCKQSLVETLRLLQWDVVAAHETDLPNIAPDDEVVAFAHRQGRTTLTFDKMRGESGQSVAMQIRESGGRVIRIPGGPQQSAYTSSGRLLFHHHEWHPFLTRQDGVAILSDVRHPCKLYTPKEYLKIAHPRQAQQFEDYLRRKRKPRSDKGVSRSSVPTQQSPLLPTADDFCG